VTVHDSSKLEGGDAVNNQRTSWGFRFHSVLHNATQDQVFDQAGKHVVNSVVNGTNGAIMAYGQTGAGKTFTMIGDTRAYTSRGVAPRAISQLFSEIDARPESVFSVQCSYMEIYNDKIRDLLDDVAPLPTGPQGGDAGVKSREQALSDAKASNSGSGAAAAMGELTIVEDSVRGTIVRGLTLLPLPTEEAALDALFQGELRRTTAEHTLNRRSNRSHCIFTLYVTQRSRLGTADKAIASKLHLVDLAGSERIKKTLGLSAMTGKSLTDETMQRESMSINRSLSILEQCVVALTNSHRSHVPFRSSTLTNVLKDSIGGKCRTVLLACIWGERDHLEESISTLNLAARMMRVKSSPSQVGGIIVDEAARAAKLEREVRELKQELAMHDALAERGRVVYDEYGPEERETLKGQLRAFVEAETVEDEDAAIELSSVRQMRELLRLAKELIRSAESDAAEAKLGEAAMTEARAVTPAVTGAARGRVEVVVDDDAAKGGLVGAVEDGVSGVSLGRVAADSRPAVDMRTQPRGVARPPPSGPEEMARTVEFMAPSGADGEGKDDVEVGGEAAEDVARSGDHHAAWDAYRRPGGPGARLAVQLRAAVEEAASSKGLVEEAAVEVNGLKSTIDRLSKQLADRQRARGGHEEKDAVGNPIVDAEEFQLLQKLSETKKAYRSASAVLNARADAARGAARHASEIKADLVRSFGQWFEHLSGVRLGGGQSSPLRGVGGAVLGASPLSRAAKPSPFMASPPRSSMHSPSMSSFGGSPTRELVGFESSTMELQPGESGERVDDGEAFERLEAERVAAEQPDALAFFQAGKRMTGTLRESARVGRRLAHRRDK
jgi:kinesin family member 6/9